MNADIRKSPFGRLCDGREAHLFTLTNSGGARLCVTDYGGVITAIDMPDRQGRLANVVLGYDTLRAYEDDPFAMGGLVGRYANRMAYGRFEIDGCVYQLPQNQGAHHLHGGCRGFHKCLWSAEERPSQQGPQVILRRISPDGEEGYPGDVSLELVYTLTEDNAVMMDVKATTTRPTPINLTQHSYFNLTGRNGSILNHMLSVSADDVLRVDADHIPTGEKQNVVGTPFDFRTRRTIGERIKCEGGQLAPTQGYDHCYVLERKNKEAARLEHMASGRVLTVVTDQPGLQVYTGNALSGIHAPRTGICLETQHFPDSPNHRGFPNTILRPGEMFTTRTVFQFGLMETSADANGQVDKA